MDLSGQVAIVTGAGSGIGKAIAMRLSSAGASVAVVDRHAASAAETVELLKGQAGTASSHRANVASEREVEDCVDAVLAVHSRIDILINNAGFSILKPLVEMSFDEWTSLVATNQTGCFLFTRAVVPIMRAQDYGRIVNIGSVSGDYGLAGRGAYAATKGAVHAMTRVLSSELARHGITVNAVAPGPIESAMTREVLSGASRDGWERALHVKRYGEASEIAAGVLYLASREAGFVTGHVLRIDGGFSAGTDLGDVTGL